MAVHTIPVPRGYTPEQAWAEITVFGEFPEYRWWKPRYWFCSWATVEVDD